MTRRKIFFVQHLLIFNKRDQIHTKNNVIRCGIFLYDVAYFLMERHQIHAKNNVI